MASKKTLTRQRRKRSIRKRISGTAERPRLSVFRSNKHIYAQVIDDVSGTTLASSSSQAESLRDDAAGKKKTEIAGLVGQLTCAILCWIYLLFVVGSHVLATNGSGNNIFQELPATIRFASDLTFTMVCFIGIISGAAAIHTDCILPPSILPADACFACPQSDQLDPTVTDPECKLEGGTPDGPYMCAKKCKNAFRL